MDKNSWVAMETSSLTTDNHIDSTTSLAVLNESDMMTEEPPSVTYTIHILTAVFLILVVIFICGGNILVMITIRKTRDVHSVTKKFIINLAVADFLIGVLTLHRILFELKPSLVDSYWSCALRSFLILLTYYTSAATLTGE